VRSSDGTSVVRVAQEALARAGGDRAPVSVGISEAHPGGSIRLAFEEALSAAEVGALMRGGGGVSSFEELGPYRYLVRGGDDGTDRQQRALTTLAAYDARRRTRLLETLEAYLDRRGNLAATARALYVHPNTLRQRLGRIRRLTGIDPVTDDWLSLAIAVKLVRLKQMRGTLQDQREPGRGEADG
jgi:purine catabolism regulator